MLGRFAVRKVSVVVLIPFLGMEVVPGRRVGVIVVALRSSNGEGGLSGAELLFPDVVRFRRLLKVNLLDLPDLPDILVFREVGVG